MTEIRSITFLRFVAALYVLLYHLMIHSHFPLRDIWGNFLIHGAGLGMTLFFTLSGFILAYNYYATPTPLGVYYQRRIARIMPVYFLAAVLTLPWFWSFTPAPPAHNFGFALLLVGLNFFTLQAWILPTTYYWNDGASWSVSVEAFFYLLFPLVIYCLRNATCRQVVITGVVAYALVAGISLISNHMFHTLSAYFYYTPIYRLPEFILGAAVGTGLVRGYFKLPKPNLCCLLITAAILAFVFSVKAPEDNHVASNYFVTPLLALLMVGLAQTSHTWFSRRVLGNPVFHLLGRSSYCIYLLQSLAIMPLLSNRAQIIAAVPALADDWIRLAACLVFVIGAAISTHLGFEEPLRKYISRKRFFGGAAII